MENKVVVLEERFASMQATMEEGINQKFVVQQGMEERMDWKLTKIQLGMQEKIDRGF